MPVVDISPLEEDTAEDGGHTRETADPILRQYGSVIGYHSGLGVRLAIMSRLGLFESTLESVNSSQLES